MADHQIIFGVFDYRPREFTEHTHAEEAAYVGYVLIVGDERAGPFENKSEAEQHVQYYADRAWAKGLNKDRRNLFVLSEVLQQLVGRRVTTIDHNSDYFYLYVGNIELYFTRSAYLEYDERPRSISFRDGKIVKSVEGTVLTFEDDTTHDLGDIRSLDSVYP